jgi:sigma-B regulation protein RsbU (phosphoserine phosphatase)
VARLDPATGALVYVNAGHNPPLLQRSDGRLETLTEGGVVLGLFESASYQRGSARLEPGDTLVVFSDGVTETWNPDDEEFGEEGLGRVLAGSLGQDAPAVETAILRELEAFEAGGGATDDRTLLVLKREPGAQA